MHQATLKNIDLLFGRELTTKELIEELQFAMTVQGPSPEQAVDPTFPVTRIFLGTM